jgi:hypothetical protein
MIEAVRTALALLGLIMLFVGLALRDVPLALATTGALLIVASLASVWLARR